MSRDVLKDSNSNWLAWLTSMAEPLPRGEVQSFGAIPAVSTGAPIPLFNQAFVFGEPSVDDLEHAVSWLGQRGVPFWVTAPAGDSDAVLEIAEAVDLSRSADSMPGMVISLSDFSPATPEGLEIEAVTDAEQLDAVAAVLGEAFGAPPEVARALNPDSMLEDDQMAWIVGLVEGEPAGCGQLLQTGDVAGVYSIAVREKFRRRGFGEAVSHAVLSAGRARRCEIGVLQASPMGRPVYERMGFEVVVDYHLFEPAS